MPADIAFLTRPVLRSGSRNFHLLAALAAALATLAFYAFQGFTALENPSGDNDAVLRLVQVRDLIAGQGWFDLTQYRMGPEGGFIMHWSRLIDTPIAVLILAATFLTGNQALGEAVALVLWPQLLFAASLFLILRIARRFSGETALLPAFVIGAITLHASGLFHPGAIDHHTAQLVLTLALLHLLLAEPSDRTAAFGAGACAALMLAIGMETLFYVATGGLCAAALYLLNGQHEARRAGRFGIAFAGVSAAVFLTTVPPSTWFAAQCDAFSIAQTSLAIGAGLGLWAVARFASSDDAMRRAGFLAALGAVLAAAALIGFPQCLGDPFEGLDPRLRTYWLDRVMEAQSAYALLVEDAAQIATYYATPLLALCVLGVRLKRSPRRADWIVAGFLASAVLVSIWQVRGAVFALPLAVIPLSAWVAEWRMRAESRPSSAGSVKLVLVWLLSFNLVWHTAASAASGLVGPQAAQEADESESPDDCYRAADYERLARLPAGTVLAVSNLGASILGFTGHRALAGSYHRNVAGNLLVLDALMGSEETARKVVRESGVDTVAFCPGNDESLNFATWAPTGLEAALRRGKAPDWLEPVAGSEAEPLRIYRVRPQHK